MTLSCPRQYPSEICRGSLQWSAGQQLSALPYPLLMAGPQTVQSASSWLRVPLSGGPQTAPASSWQCSSHADLRGAQLASPASWCSSPAWLRGSLRRSPELLLSLPAHCPPRYASAVRGSRTLGPERRSCRIPAALLLFAPEETVLLPLRPVAVHAMGLSGLKHVVVRGRWRPPLRLTAHSVPPRLLRVSWLPELLPAESKLSSGAKELAASPR